ncbi:MAG: hypothetical protein EP332_03815 [Bacteroidetes bacterium]|nr:MAG: hypothetical protein EP332_03815 [Bacteroidota bacterium]
MKKRVNLVLLTVLILGLYSCERDEGILPEINFKTGGSYISTSDSVNAGAAILIGIEAKKTEDKDVLKKFTVTKSINGAAGVTVISHDLSGADGDAYAYDYNETVENTSGQTNTYTFTVTNRDGLVNQVSLDLHIR